MSVTIVAVLLVGLIAIATYKESAKRVRLVEEPGEAIYEELVPPEEAEIVEAPPVAQVPVPWEPTPIKVPVVEEKSMEVKVEEAAPPTKPPSLVMEKIDTDGDGIPDTFVIKGVPGAAPVKRVAEKKKAAEASSKTIPVIDREYLPYAERIIRESKESISIAMFVAKRGEKVDSLIEELKKAAERGVKIRILLDDGVADNQSTMKFLARIKNVWAKLDSPEKTTHNKIIISDNKIVLIGSTNWTEMSLGYANEANVMIEDRKIAEYFQKYFDYLWKDSSKDISPFKSFRGETIPIIDREYFDVVQATMEKAKERILVMVYGFKLSGLGDTRADLLADEMIKAKKRGVEVKVILEKSDFNEWLNRMNSETIEYFKKNGVEAKLDREDIITHAKVVIIDDSVFLGSTNWSYGGLELWHNSDILIRNKKIVDFFVNYFEEKFNE